MNISEIPAVRKYVDERGRLWVQCNCGRWVRPFKALIGSVHICDPAFSYPNG